MLIRQSWNVLSESADGQDLLTVSGAQTYPANGALRMTTVSVSGCPGHPVTFFMLVGAWLDENQSVIDRDQVCPDSLTEEEVEQEGQAQMTSSQDAAVVAALMESGMASRMILTVAGVSEQQTAALAEGDVLESITPAGGTTTTITTYPELREILSTIPAGTTVTLGITRDGQAVDVELTTLAPQDQDGDGRADSEGSLLGLYLSARADSEIDAEFALSMGLPWDADEETREAAPAPDLDPSRVTEPIDRAVLAALADVVETATTGFEAYEHARALEATESFFWTFCDDYIELVKDRANDAEGTHEAAAVRSARTTLAIAVDTFVRLFAPFLPFVTEEVWS